MSTSDSAGGWAPGRPGAARASAGGGIRLSSVDEHLDRVLRQINTPGAIELAVLDAQGLLCAEEVVAQIPLPGFDSAALDGYAVRCDDIADATDYEPAVLPVVADIAAGSRMAQRIQRGQCVRIMTGAPMPAGADAVVPAEWTDRGVARVAIFAAPGVGEHIRRIGADVEPGDVAVLPGTPIGPAQVGLLAAVGRERILARPRPRVVVISTGSELVDIGQSPGPGEISDVNSYSLAAAARDAGAEVYRVGIVPDDRRRLIDALEGQLLRADILITSGGTSAGSFDVVKEALAEIGSVSFETVAMRPGMPQGFGTLGPSKAPFFGLPGNPVAALVSFEIFVRPAIRLMLGKKRLFRRTVQAVARVGFDSPGGVKEYRSGLLRRERAGGYSVEPLGDSGAHLLTSMAQANCLIAVDEPATEVPEGGHVTVIPLLLAGV